MSGIQSPERNILSALCDWQAPTSRPRPCSLPSSLSRMQSQLSSPVETNWSPERFMQIIFLLNRAPGTPSCPMHNPSAVQCICGQSTPRPANRTPLAAATMSNLNIKSRIGKCDPVLNMDCTSPPSQMSPKQSSRLSFHSIVHSLRGRKYNRLQGSYNDAASDENVLVVEAESEQPKPLLAETSPASSELPGSSPPSFEPPPVPPKSPSRELLRRAEKVREQMQQPSVTRARHQKIASSPGAAARPRSRKPSGRVRKSKRNMYAERRRSTLSVTSSMAAVAVYIADNRDPSPELPELPSESWDQQQFDLLLESPKTESNQNADRNRKRSSFIATFHGLLSAGRKKESTPEIVQFAVDKLTFNMDEQFRKFDSELALISDDLSLQPTAQAPEVEIPSRFRRLLNRCRRRHQSRGRINRIWQHVESVSGVSRTFSSISSPSLGDLGSPPISLRAQSAPVK